MWIADALAGPLWPAFVFLVLLAVNLVTYAVFGWDKAQARSGGWRVAENTLLLLACLGGWPAAKLAQRQLRHKTRKQPFGTLLNLVPVAWIALGVVILLA